MTSAAITKTTLHSQAWENVKNVVDTRTVVADPLQPENKKARKFVYIRHPHPNARGNNLYPYPYIVVNPPSIRKEIKSVDGNLKEIEWTCILEVRTSDSDRRARGAQDLDSINDDVLAIDNDSNGDTLRGYRMNFPKIDLIDSDLIKENGADIFMSDFEMTFKTMMLQT